MVSPFEILLDAQLALCNSPEWSELPYPSDIHMAHDILDRAGIHLGIRALEGYPGKRSTSEELWDRLPPLGSIRLTDDAPEGYTVEDAIREQAREDYFDAKRRGEDC